MATNGNLIKYVRDKKGNRRGVVVATYDPNRGIVVGWSLCNKNDVFDRDIALIKAFGRTRSSLDNDNEVPASLLNAILEIVRRAGKYYKQANV